MFLWRKGHFWTISKICSSRIDVLLLWRVPFHFRVKTKNIEGLAETVFSHLLKWNCLGYKIKFIESSSFNYNVIPKNATYDFSRIPSHSSRCTALVNVPRAEAQGVDGPLGTGHAKPSPVILSDFQTSEKGKTNPLSTAILSKLFFCNFFGGDSDNKNLSSFDKTSY